tara:strand:- start:1689 stop:1856 length:168 start_codon:yes stop_codon:yes gene_type:complete
MSELHIMLSNGDTIEQIADWIILLNVNRGTHITRQKAMDTASHFWHDFDEVECPP